MANGFKINYLNEIKYKAILDIGEVNVLLIQASFVPSNFFEIYCTKTSVNWKVLPLNKPLSLNFNSGMTKRAMKDKLI
jgi:hypothetical protein